jgi:hypothetical protein
LEPQAHTRAFGSYGRTSLSQSFHNHPGISYSTFNGDPGNNDHTTDIPCGDDCKLGNEKGQGLARELRAGRGQSVFDAEAPDFDSWK